MALQANEAVIYIGPASKPFEKYVGKYATVQSVSVVAGYEVVAVVFEGEVTIKHVLSTTLQQ